MVLLHVTIAIACGTASTVEFALAATLVCAVFPLYWNLPRVRQVAFKAGLSTITCGHTGVYQLRLQEQVSQQWWWP